MMAMQVGDEVTILPPYDDDPILVSMQRFGRIDEIVDGPGGRCYMVALGATNPPLRYACSRERLAPGWHDEYGRWRTR